MENRKPVWEEIRNTLKLVVKQIKNKQRPDLCYCYEKKENNLKYIIFTMNGGKSFLASVEELRKDGRYYSVRKTKVSSVDEAIDFFVKGE